MKIVCAWCGAILQDGNSNGQRSHGICVSCAVEFEVEAITLEVMSLVGAKRKAAPALPSETYSLGLTPGKRAVLFAEQPRAWRDNHNNYQGD